MRQTVLLNSEISSVISRMGHTDMLTVGDCGLPVPEGVQRIDLALRLGVPRFLEVLDTILEELCVEKIILAEEICTASPEAPEARELSFHYTDNDKGRFARFSIPELALWNVVWLDF